LQLLTFMTFIRFGEVMHSLENECIILLVLISTLLMLNVKLIFVLNICISHFFIFSFILLFFFFFIWSRSCTEMRDGKFFEIQYFWISFFWDDSHRYFFHFFIQKKTRKNPNLLHSNNCKQKVVVKKKVMWNSVVTLEDV
jgi:hypothetical protein